AGHRLAEWLRAGGHDVLDAREFGTDPGDKALLERAAADDRVLVTIDTDFGELIYLHGVAHAGLIRLPDVPMRQRIAIMEGVLASHRAALESGAVLTVREGRVRVSMIQAKH
ncbi:MAG: DUF5615 family PIN-like protein, partial [Gammaproteobacteria bacterium]|nr:DUF5615 family PIN-like protein [Gammaproteobacteria bacterium]